MINLNARNLEYERIYSPNPFIVNIENLPIVPLFSLDFREYNLSINVPSVNISNPESLFTILDKYEMPSNLHSSVGYTFRRFMGYNKEQRLKEKEKVFGTDFKFKPFINEEKGRVLNTVQSYIRQIRQINEYSKKDVYINRLIYYPIAGNNVSLIRNFVRDGHSVSYQRNGQNLHIHRQSIFRHTEEGIYPVLIVGYDKGTLEEFKGKLLRYHLYKNTTFSNVKVCLDYEWFMSTTNKVLKSTLLKNLETMYPGFDVILFDGKKFSSENMFAYTIPSFKTLAKKKEYYRNIETDFIKHLLTQLDAEDYNPEIELFYKTYKDFLENAKEVKEEKPVSGVITEERALTQEDIDMINSLMVETTGDSLLSESSDDDDDDIIFEEEPSATTEAGPMSVITGQGIFEQIRNTPSIPYAPQNLDPDVLRSFLNELIIPRSTDRDVEHIRINLEANGIPE